ncbi:hypothetical protein HDU91_004036, partial [Kappamyces sp. JEL0680]
MQLKQVKSADELSQSSKPRVLPSDAPVLEFQKVVLKKINHVEKYSATSAAVTASPPVSFKLKAASSLDQAPSLEQAPSAASAPAKTPTAPMKAAAAPEAVNPVPASTAAKSDAGSAPSSPIVFAALRSVAKKPIDFEGPKVVAASVRTKREEEAAQQQLHQQSSPLKKKFPISNAVPKVSNTVTVEVSDGKFDTPVLKKAKEEASPFLPQSTNLYMIKGKKRIFIKNVPLSASSLNESDAFVLVSPKEIFCYIGEQSGPVKKAKAKDVMSRFREREFRGQVKATLLDQKGTRAEQ